MNWRSIQFDWNRARAFLVTAEEGSYSAAAKALGMSQPTLGRQVSALEKELGVALFEKVGKGLSLTPSGQELLEHVRQMANAASDFSLAATGQSHSIEGSICISASEAMAAYVLAPLMKKLRLHAPGLQVEIIASNQASDLRKREADIAIRNFKPDHAELITRKLENARAHLYATPDYIQKLPAPINKEALQYADFVGFTNNAPILEALQHAAIPITESNFPLITENHLVHWEIVKSGAAIGIMSELIGDQEPLVNRVLPDMEPFIFETWLVVHREVRTNRKVRLVFDFLINEFQALSLAK